MSAAPSHDDTIRREDLVRPEPLPETPVPPLPDVTAQSDAQASTTYSHYRTGLSRHRTRLSEHRTQLSEFRTDLSRFRTELSTHRTEMSMRRTGMSFHRTRMSADRTLMSVMRTALSLIGFGFTIFQFFGRLHESQVLRSSSAARNFGTALVLIGIMVLIFGIIYHVRFMTGLRRLRSDMKVADLVHGESRYPVSLALVAAVVVLLLGLLAIASMVFNLGPFD